ncbi:trp operon leader peptide [Streptomyces sp. SID8014]|uniref:Trp operon leader peptide n=1 Tax=Streptomyces rutgersensis TaxID=53451 RepID=A0ABX6RKC6_9ACTN|nr:trp operon leader peptide [Streptomyces sp. BRB081]NEC16198.1 trp operon leader peptide [Streptomyces sp. SID8014]NEE25924.1 trp operon leader peptide [Streptomyces sp. SID7982]NEE49310.1 trp operon leader peptide [Streptomyces sp. SID8455]QNE80780.1 trp operon leader peptide [Streptomyces rutgersensis]
MWDEGHTRRGKRRKPRTGCARIAAMIAQQTRNWWWTAHPAAH